MVCGACALASSSTVGWRGSADALGSLDAIGAETASEADAESGDAITPVSVGATC